MYESLPPPLRHWVTGQAEAMGLPDPDHYIVLLLRLEKQQHDLAAILAPVPAANDKEPA